MVEKNYETPRTNIVQDFTQKSKSKDLAMHHKLVCCLMGVEHKSFILGDKIVHNWNSNHILYSRCFLFSPSIQSVFYFNSNFKWFKRVSRSVYWTYFLRKYLEVLRIQIVLIGNLVPYNLVVFQSFGEILSLL